MTLILLGVNINFIRIILRRPLEGKIIFGWNLAPSWSKVLKAWDLFLQIGGSFPCIRIVSSSVEDTFPVLECIPPVWRIVFQPSNWLLPAGASLSRVFRGNRSYI
ncbi:MAG: hypothetical protein R2774_03635 [Saprospiraceae bacterium]